MPAFTTTSVTDDRWYGAPHPAGVYRSRCVVPKNLFNSGRYSFSVSLVERQSEPLDVARRAVSIDMVDYGDFRGGYFGHWSGVVRPLLDWKTDNVGEPLVKASS